MPVLNVENITAEEAAAEAREQAEHHPWPDERFREAVAAIERMCRHYNTVSTEQIRTVIRRALGQEWVTVHTLSASDNTIGLDEGADLPLDEVLGIISVADEVGWCHEWMGGHNLAVYSGGHHYNFRVRKP